MREAGYGKDAYSGPGHLYESIGNVHPIVVAAYRGAIVSSLFLLLTCADSANSINRLPVNNPDTPIPAQSRPRHRA